MTDQGSHHASRPLATLLRSLRHRNFRLFFSGQLVSLVGTWMQSVAQSWLVYRLTGSALLLGANAIALNSSMFNGARVVGPAVAGVLVAVIGEGWCFFLNGVSFLAVIVSLLVMRVDRTERPRGSGSALGDLLEGFRFAWRTVPIRALLLLLGLVSVVAMPYTVLMPIFADRILHGGPRALGLLMGATGVGALAGALSLAARATVRGLGRWVAYASAGFGASLILFAESRILPLSAAILVLVGFC